MQSVRQFMFELYKQRRNKMRHVFGWLHTQPCDQALCCVPTQLPSVFAGQHRNNDELHNLCHRLRCEVNCHLRLLPAVLQLLHHLHSHWRRGL